MSEIKGNVSRALRELRESRGLSQRALAKELGISNSSIAMYESEGRAPSFDVLCAYSRFFGVTVSDIVSDGAGEEAERISDEDIRFALSNGDQPITEAQFEEVKKFVQFIKSRDAQK